MSILYRKILHDRRYAACVQVSQSLQKYNFDVLGNLQHALLHARRAVLTIDVTAYHAGYERMEEDAVGCMLDSAVQTSKDAPRLAESRTR